MPGPWFTASELAGLPGMPVSEFRTRARLDKMGVPSRLRAGRAGGGGREFDSAFLPAETRAALVLRATEPCADGGASASMGSDAGAGGSAVAQAGMGGTPAGANHEAPRTDVSSPAARRPPSRADTECADARAILVRCLTDLAPLCGGVTKAAQQLVQQLATGVAAPNLVAAARTASQRARSTGNEGSARVSVRSLFAWHTAHASGGWHGLLPAPKAPAGTLTTLDDDVQQVLRRYASSAGSARNLTHVAQAVNLDMGRAFDDWRSLYDRARRALAKVDKVSLIKARHTGAERAAKLPFKRRDASVFSPMDIVVCDGHTFKAKVRHPDHGQPFAPEVTAVMDVVTRLVVGWSVSLSESTIAVGDAMRHTVAQHGVPALVYTDNGSGERAKYFDCPVTGLFERLGCDHRTGLPRHPQGHGVIERAWKTHMIRAARQFATYQGGDADDGKLRDVGLELAREQRAVARAATSGEVVRLSAKCPSWTQFLDAVERAFREYNALHRHRGLPKHADGPVAGKHMTPAEAMAALLVPGDVQRLDEPTLRNVFMPARLCTAQRGEVRFLNQHYFAPELMQVDGEKVRVHYDIHDPGRVWVWTVGGDYLCEAAWGANRIDYFPKAVVQMAREKRVRAAIKRREAQIDTARRELQPTLPAPAGDAPAIFIGDLSAGSSRRELDLVERLPDPPAHATSSARDSTDRPFFDSASDRYEWLMQHRAVWTADDTAWMQAYADSADYTALRDYYASRGLQWADDDDRRSFDQAG